MKNNSLYKILKFEFKQNTFNWAITISIFLSILVVITFRNATGHSPLILKGSVIPMMVLFSGIFTLYSYSESTSRQSMQMYHLLPVSRKLKFFSKQLITFIIAPIVFVMIYLFYATAINTLITGTFSTVLLSPNIKPLKILGLFIWSHSLSTFFAILFKKRKLIYAFVTYLAFQFALIITFVTWSNISGSTEFKRAPIAITGNFFESIPFVLTLLIPLALYIISYRLFFRRQL